jgi:hypothetical protein
MTRLSRAREKATTPPTKNSGSAVASPEEFPPELRESPRQNHSTPSPPQPYSPHPLLDNRLFSVKTFLLTIKVY